MYIAVDLFSKDCFLTFCHFLVTSPYVQNCCSNLTKQFFINSYTSRNQLYYSTTSPNDFSSIRTPHEIICIPFYHLTKRLFINSFTSRNHLYTILPPHQTTFHQLVRLTKSTVYHSTTSPNDFHQLVRLKFPEARNAKKSGGKKK